MAGLTVCSQVGITALSETCSAQSRVLTVCDLAVRAYLPTKGGTEAVWHIHSQGRGGTARGRPFKAE